MPPATTLQENDPMTGPQWLFTLAGATILGAVVTAALAWWILWS